VNGKARLNQTRNACPTKNQRAFGAGKLPIPKGRGRPRSRNKKDIRVSFRVDWNTYKKLVEQAGGKRRLSGFIRKALGVE
jgi:hypothetical protein